MMTPSPERNRDTRGQAYVWASRASSIAMGAVIPAALGYWLDRQWGTSPWLVIVGAGLGFASMIQGLLRLTQIPDQNRTRPHNPRPTDNVPKD